MKREIYQVVAYIVDANGTYNSLSGYPKNFDSHSYNDDVRKAEKRAYGDFCEVQGALSKRDDRQVQHAALFRLSDGKQLFKFHDGTLADLPDPEPVVEDTSEPVETPTDENTEDETGDEQNGGE